MNTIPPTFKNDLLDQFFNYKELVDLLPEIIFCSDKQLNLIYGNKMAFKKFGFSIEDFNAGINIFSVDQKLYHRNMN